MKSWYKRLVTPVTFILGVVCGGLVMGFLSISMMSMLASIELQHQFSMKHAAYRFLATNDVPRTQAALIAQMSIDVCAMTHELETRTVLPFARRKMVSDLQSVRDSLDYYGLDLGSVEASTKGATSAARRAHSSLVKHTVAGPRRSTEPNSPANGSQPIRSETRSIGKP
jgi:hypothetical protein